MYASGLQFAAGLLQVAKVIGQDASHMDLWCGSAQSGLVSAPRPLRGRGGIDSVDGLNRRLRWESVLSIGPEGQLIDLTIGSAKADWLHIYICVV